MVAISLIRSEMLTFIRLYKTTKASRAADTISTTVIIFSDAIRSPKLSLIPEKYDMLSILNFFMISEPNCCCLSMSVLVRLAMKLLRGAVSPKHFS